MLWKYPYFRQIYWDIFIIIYVYIFMIYHVITQFFVTVVRVPVSSAEIKMDRNERKINVALILDRSF